MQIVDKQKISILILALKERYVVMHKIRERIQSVGLWALGIMFAAGGWLVQSKISLTFLEKVVYVTGVVFAFYVLNEYLKDLQVGFKNQQCTAARLENTLGFFTPGFFSDEDSSIYPPEWQHAGTESGTGNFFITTYRLLYVGAGFLIISILLAGMTSYNHDIRPVVHYWQLRPECHKVACQNTSGKALWFPKFLGT